MDSRQPEDLGTGVRVVPLPGAGWQVRSPRLELPWHVRVGRVAGSAVIWLDRPWEVTRRDGAGPGFRWTLEPWPETEAMRVVHTLDSCWIEKLACQRLQETRSGRLRWGLLPVLPVLGLIPASLQSRWHLDWGFPAVVATTLSAIAELAIAAFGTVHMLASAFGGAGILPAALSWLGPLAPLLFVESTVRLKHVMGNQEPIGSVVGLPLAVLVPRSPPAAPPERPMINRFDDDSGVLELDSPIYRKDWSPGAALRYRDRPYELVRVERLGPGWRYHFTRTVTEDRRSSLRMMPPGDHSASERRGRPLSRVGQGPGVIRVALTTAVACMSLRRDQERWAAAIGASPTLLTVLGAGAQIFGALVNLSAAGAAHSTITVLLDAYLLGEGIFRYAGLLITGRPAGSAIGFATRPFMERAIRSM